MSCEHIVNSLLLKFFCAATEILNEYNCYVAEKVENGKDELGFKEFAEDMSKKLLDCFVKMQVGVIENVKKIESEESLSFDFSDNSESPAADKKKFEFRTPPTLVCSLLESKTLKFKSENNSRIKKLDISNEEIARNLFKD